jgi:hypothetical protein
MQVRSSATPRLVYDLPVQSAGVKCCQPREESLPAIVVICRIQRATAGPRVIEQRTSTSRWLKVMSGPPTRSPTVAATCIATLPVNTGGPPEKIAPTPNPPETNPTSDRTKAQRGPSPESG